MAPIPETSVAPAPGVVEAPPPGGDPVAHTLALLQPWIDFVPKQQRRLGVFVFLALLAHLTAFFFIRIDTTHAELRHVARTHVTVEDALPSAEAEAGDAFWDRLTDPRLFLLPMTPLADLSLEEAPLPLSSINPGIGPHRLPPSAAATNYALVRTAFPSLETQAEETMRPSRQPFRYDDAAPPTAAATAWQWGPALAQRAPTGGAPLPSPVSDTELNPTELRVAVDPDGTVEHVLLEETCQKPELDQLAILAAQKVRFDRTDRPGLDWGHLTVFWHYTAQPREEVVPTPPSSP